ncbi:MAG: amidase, partial [Bacillota bacterium]
LQTRNPWNPDHIPGGSSGGSAVAVAAGMVPAALGSDTGGSVREPASYCGVVGYKPTYGTVSRCGLVAFAPSLDQIGPLTNSVKDAAIMMNIIAGYDKNDPYSVQINISDYTKNIGDNISGLTFALAKNHLNIDVSPEVKEVIIKTCSIIRKHGGKVIEVELPEIELMKIAYYIIAFSEVYLNISNLEEAPLKMCFGKDVLKGILEYSGGKQLNEEIKRRVLLGCLMVEQGNHYQRAIRYRTWIIQKFNQIFHKSDFILSPTSPYLPRKIVEKKDPISEYSSPEFTTWANLTGRPALSIPASLSSQELPIGIQLIGDYFAESVLFQAGAYLESVFNFKYLIDRKAKQETS